MISKLRARSVYERSMSRTELADLLDQAADELALARKRLGPAGYAILEDHRKLMKRHHDLLESIERGQ